MSSATLASLSIGDLTVAGVTLDGHAISVGTLSAVAQTLSQDAPAVSFVPVTVDGTKTGEVTVTPANSPKTVGALAAPALPLGVLSATSPTATLTAAKSAAGPISSVSASLGQASVLGLPLGLDGTVSIGSATDAAKAQAGKTLKITNVALPNLADLLAALGIDLKKLPVGTLNGLVSTLPVTITSAAQTAINTANDAIDAADGAYDTAAAGVATAAQTLATEAAELDAVLAAATLPSPMPALPTGMDLPLTHLDWDELSTTPAGVLIQDAILGLNGVELDDALSDYVDAKAALATANAALATALAAIQPLVDDLADLVDGVLAGNPLVSIDAAEIGTNALASATKAAAVTGSITGIKVLGQDVLATVTGSSTLDAVALAGTVATQVQQAVNTVTGQLSSVLSSVTGAAGLVVPAPSVKFLQKSTSTGMEGAFGVANVLVTALQVDMGSISVPTQFALPGAGALPGILPSATGFKTAPLSVKVGVLGEVAKYRPASTTGSNPGSHPATGAPAGLAIVAVIGTALAFGARRASRSEA